MVTSKEKLQAKLTKINSGKEGRRKASGKGSVPIVECKQKRLFGAGLHYKFPINIFSWTYNYLKKLINA